MNLGWRIITQEELGHKCLSNKAWFSGVYVDTLSSSVELHVCMLCTEPENRFSSQRYVTTKEFSLMPFLPSDVIDHLCESAFDLEQHKTLSIYKTLCRHLQSISLGSLSHTWSMQFLPFESYACQDLKMLELASITTNTVPSSQSSNSSFSQL